MLEVLVVLNVGKKIGVDTILTFDPEGCCRGHKQMVMAGQLSQISYSAPYNLNLSINN